MMSLRDAVLRRDNAAPSQERALSPTEQALVVHAPQLRLFGTPLPPLLDAVASRYVLQLRIWDHLQTSRVSAGGGAERRIHNMDHDDKEEEDEEMFPLARLMQELARLAQVTDGFSDDGDSVPDLSVSRSSPTTTWTTTTTTTMFSSSSTVVRPDGSMETKTTVQDADGIRKTIVSHVDPSGNLLETPKVQVVHPNGKTETREATAEEMDQHQMRHQSHDVRPSPLLDGMMGRMLDWMGLRWH